MLNIVIVKGKDDGELELIVNGHPNNGNSSADRNEDVHWRVDENCNVLRIDDIKIKTGPGAPPSTNIFSDNPPRRQDGPHSKNWRAKVNRNAPRGAEYNYDIVWVPKAGGGTKTYDPKIAVNSRFIDPAKVFFIILSIIAGLFSLEFLRRKMKNR
jgi:hypothetical protein